jgi:hypothetical protein
MERIRKQDGPLATATMAFLVVALRSNPTVIFIARRFLPPLLPYLLTTANLLAPFSKINDQVSSCSPWQKQIWLHFVANYETSANGHKIQPQLGTQTQKVWLCFMHYVYESLTSTPRNGM